MEGSGKKNNKDIEVQQRKAIKMNRVGSNICPECGHRFPAHKDNTKTFEQLTTKERENSVRMMAINLKRAINSDLASTRTRRIFWVIEYMARRVNR